MQWGEKNPSGVEVRSANPYAHLWVGANSWVGWNIEVCNIQHLQVGYKLFLGKFTNLISGCARSVSRLRFIGCNCSPKTRTHGPCYSGSLVMWILSIALVRTLIVLESVVSLRVRTLIVLESRDLALIFCIEILLYVYWTLCWKGRFILLFQKGGSIANFWACANLRQLFFFFTITQN